MKFVNTSIRKKDAVQLVTGKPVYTEDIAPSNCLVVKLMKSPYANAIIEDNNLQRCKSKEIYSCRSVLSRSKSM